ncbi:MAG: hypothetical protein M1358_01960 [Chloroflexi bacterium]|nr:hypothetical protein [Chloroflexota bacterium]
MLSLISRVLASREVELRNSEMEIEIESLRRKLDLHRRYALRLNGAVEQALLALCRVPELSVGLGELDDKAQSAPHVSHRNSGPPTEEESRGDAPLGPGHGYSPGDDREAGARDYSSQMMDAAEARANALLKEASDILSRAQESARQILERAIAQGAEIVSRAEEQSRHIDEKVTEVGAVTSPPGSTVYQRALELAQQRRPTGLDDARMVDDEQAAEVLSAPGAIEPGLAHEDAPAQEESKRSGDGAVSGYSSRQNGCSLTTVGISPLRSFSPVVGLEEALRATEGVRQVRVLSFRGGLLEMAVEHDPEVSLVATLQSIPGFEFRVEDSSDSRLELSLSSSGGPEASNLPPVLSTPSAPEEDEPDEGDSASQGGRT